MHYRRAGLLDLRCTALLRLLPGEGESFLLLLGLLDLRLCLAGLRELLLFAGLGLLFRLGGLLESLVPLFGGLRLLALLEGLLPLLPGLLESRVLLLGGLGECRLLLIDFRPGERDTDLHCINSVCMSSFPLRCCHCGNAAQVACHVQGSFNCVYTCNPTRQIFRKLVSSVSRAA